MKRIFVLLFLCLFIFSSCAEKRDHVALLAEFTTAYGMEGVIYSSDAEPHEEGYISPELAALIFGGELMPDGFAVLLNSRVDAPSECGAFIITDSRAHAIEICRRRLDVLDPTGENSFIAIYGELIFYCVVSDIERARRIADIVFK